MIALLALSWAMAADPAPIDELDYRGALDQARFQIRKGYWDQALADLERAVTHPDGRIDAEAWFLLAQVRLQVGDVVGARQAANQALTNARTPEQESQTASLVSLLETAYGLVRIEGTQPGIALRPRLEPATPLADPEQADLVDRLEKRVRKNRTLLPTTLSLPVGPWNINGQDVVVDAYEPLVLRLGPGAAAGGLAAARLAWLEIGAGIQVSLSGEPHLLPSPDTMVGLTVPVGGIWAVGLVSHWTATMLQTEAGNYAIDGRTGQLGVRFGPLLDDGEVVLVRPSLGYRAGSVAGLRLTCESIDGELACGDGPADLVLYANGVGHTVFAEVAADYLDRRRSSGFGAGVRLIGEHTFARIPAAGTSRGKDAFDYTVTDAGRGRSRTSVRVLVHGSVAF